MKFVMIIFFSLVSQVSFAQDPLVLINVEKDCKAEISLDDNGHSCLKVTKISDGKILSKTCANSGNYYSATTPENQHTRYQVNSKFVSKKNVYFASWIGGGLDIMPQNYTVVRKTKNGFIASEEISMLYGSDIVLCDNMKIAE